MRLPYPSRLAGLALMATGFLLGGCAYKNPLMEGSAAKPASAPTPVASAANAPASAPAASPATATASAPSPAASPAPATAAAPRPAAAAAAAAPVAANDPASAVLTPALPARSPAAAAGNPAPAPSVAAAAAAPAISTPATPGAQTSASAVQTVKEKRMLGGVLSPYRVDIQQGNFITREMVSQLRPGMTPDQVRFVLGTPLLTDPFHGSRWDYPFDIKRGNGETTRARLTVYFKDNRLERWEGGDLPTEEDYLARIAGQDEAKKKVAEGKPAAARAPSATREPK